MASGAAHGSADEGALHAEPADEPMELGPVPSAESHLATQRALEAARDTGRALKTSLDAIDSLMNAEGRWSAGHGHEGGA